MWLAGFAELPDWLVAKVGEVVWQPLQSPVAGCTLSKACGRESPQAVALLAIIPRYGALSWQVWQAATAAATVVWPATESRSEEHTSELQSLTKLVCRLLLEKKKSTTNM